MSKTIYQLNLNESVEIASANSIAHQSSTTARRVPGGWIYKTSVTISNSNGTSASQTSVFVPYSDEFKK